MNEWTKKNIGLTNSNKQFHIWTSFIRTVERIGLAKIEIDLTTSANLVGNPVLDFKVYINDVMYKVI